MPNGRAVLLLRRLSSTDNRLKTFNINQTTSKDSHITTTTPVCNNRDLCLTKRLSTHCNTNILVTQITRNLSDKITKMTTSHNETDTAEVPKYTNRLINEKSPYLLQHAHNPVEWYPWGQEAIEKAIKENKLIFLSVGYSTCHWCHVMERESFENEEVAKIMNENFVNIKVDREERPDIDKVYMLFVMAATGGGGWPMSVFLTPDLRPITGGTYFPPDDHWGRPGFKKILLSLSEKWTKEKEKVITAGTNIMEFMQKLTLVDSSQESNIPDETAWNKCVLIYTRLFEPKFGGFGKAPKFPQASIFNFLFHYYARDKANPQGKKCLDMCLYTLTKIANGGIHDHVSSGFARYSVDDDWHVPHFEKMLYDQAQLTVAYTDAYLATKDNFYADVVRDIIKYVNRDLRHELGGYFSAEDADSYPSYDDTHKKEGAFYVWDYNEIKTLLKDKNINGKSYLGILCDYFNIKSKGNISPSSDPHNELSNKNVLIVYGSKEETAEKFNMSMEEFDSVLSECIDILYVARQKRPRPHLDTKMLCSWNGLMIAGLAQAGQGLGEKEFVDDAVKAAQFIKQYLYDQKTNTLLHSCYKAEDGSIAQIKTPIKGFLDDYAFLIKGLLDLYEASLDVAWLKWARELQYKQDELFWDDDQGGYFTCSSDDSNIILRLKEDQDGAEPSGNSVSCHNLLRLAAYTDKSTAQEGGDRERKQACRLLTAFGQRLRDSPSALPEMMSALMFYVDSPTQVLISGGQSDPRTMELVRAVRSRLLPGRVLAVTDPAAPAPIGMPDILLSRLRLAGEAPAAYVCRRYACSLPVTDVKELETLLDQPSAIQSTEN